MQLTNRTGSPRYSPYVTVFPDASTNRWWTGSHCADGTCSDTFITYDFGKVSQVCKMAFPNVSWFVCMSLAKLLSNCTRVNSTKMFMVSKM